MAVKSFYEDDDTCTDYYRTLGERSSADAVNDAATAICTDQMCRNRMSNYTDYLMACRVGNGDDVRVSNMCKYDYHSLENKCLIIYSLYYIFKGKLHPKISYPQILFVMNNFYLCIFFPYKN